MPLKRFRSTTAVFLATACTGAGLGAVPALAASHYSPSKCIQQEKKILKKYSKKFKQKNLTVQQRTKIGNQQNKAISALTKHGCQLRG